MKPAAFTYHAPRSLDECVELLGRLDADEVKLLAGGQSLVPLLNLRLARPGVVVDLGRVPGLRGIRLDGGVLRVGAMTTHVELVESPVLRRAFPMIASAARHIGYPAIRNRGTAGGSIAHADPSAELPCLAVALDAELLTVGPDGGRTIRAADFFVAHFVNVLRPDEVLTEIRFPPPGKGWAFEEFTRKSGDFALAEVAMDLDLLGSTVGRARIAVGGAAATPLRATVSESALRGRNPADVDPVRIGAEVRRELCGEGSSETCNLVETLARRATINALSRLEN
ncbi:FAD binding domain-containing protein [Pseudonocardia sp. CA-107938]|uniref:FAD binding domain-containing protein n=1 Tax=Pseudonocardia sp. CA-107938 TaxID=3240021 RepID=UPI003D8F117B